MDLSVIALLMQPTRGAGYIVNENHVVLDPYILYQSIDKGVLKTLVIYAAEILPGCWDATISWNFSRMGGSGPVTIYWNKSYPTAEDALVTEAAKFITDTDERMSGSWAGDFNAKDKSSYNKVKAELTAMIEKWGRNELQLSNLMKKELYVPFFKGK